MRGLRSTFPGCDDVPLAAALLRLLARGRPVDLETLAAAAGRPPHEVSAQLRRWPNVERDGTGAVVGFSGLTLRRTAHELEVGGRRLHAWCAWDTLFLPAMLGKSARVRSSCAATGAALEIDVSPSELLRAQPAELYVSFPPPATTDPADITGSFCAHVHFLAGAGAARAWRAAHPDGEVLDLEAAFELGCEASGPWTEAAIQPPGGPAT